MKCGLLILEEFEVSEDGGVDAIARRLLEHAERTLDEVAREWTADDFLKQIDKSRKPDQRFVTRVTTLLAVQRYDEAQALCEESAAHGSSGGFWSSSLGTFNEMVMRFIAEQRTVENSGMQA
jgi:hypothetical protein